MTLNSKPQRPRKIHNREPGYIAERRNPAKSLGAYKVVIYLADDQDVDVGDSKYAVVCDAHASIVGETSVRAARISMKCPTNFCDGCRDAEPGWRETF